MIVKPDCPVKLNSFQAKRILTQLQLGNYYQSIKGGAETLPPFSGFVSELDNIAKQFFIKTDYNFNDFLNDPHNASVLENIFNELFKDTGLNDTEVIRMVNNSVIKKEDATSGTVEKAEADVKVQETTVEEERKGFFDENALQQETTPSDFRNEEFENERELYIAMFHNNNYLESKFKTKFVSNVVIRSLLIDPKTRTIVNVDGEAGEREVNKNLKEKRREILSRLLEGQPVNIIQKFTNNETGEETEQNVPITVDMAINDANVFQYLLNELENRVTKPTFNGSEVDLVDTSKENQLYVIARSADNDMNEEAIKIVNDYMDYVALRRFDDVLKHSFGNLLYTNNSIDLDNFNDDLKYKFIINTKEEASNANFTEVIKGLETISDLYNTIINNTQMLDINTGLPLSKDTLSKPKVQKAFDKFFKYVDPTDTTRSIKNLIIKGMHDDKALWEDRNILYTLYKNFFEERGDDHFGADYSETNLVETDAKETEKYPESYLQTVVHNNFDRQHALMQLLTDPLRNIAKISYVDATVNNGNIKLGVLSTTGKTSTKMSIENALFRELNDPEKVPVLIEKYKLSDSNTGLNSHAEFEYNGKLYVLLGSGSYTGEAETSIPTELITTLSKDFLNIDFDNATVDKDFKQQLLTRKQTNRQSIFPDYYLQFLRQGMKVVLAKNALLFNTEIRSAIASKKLDVDLITSNMLLNDIFKEGRAKIPLKRLDAFNVTFNRSDTLQPVLDAYGASKDRVTGNTAKSTLTNKEGNSITGYSIYNLFTGLERSLIQTKQLHNSIINYNNNANVFSHNAIVHDPNLFKGFIYRDSIEVNDRIVANSKQSVLTTYNFDINGLYFSALEDSFRNGTPTVYIDPTVYSDKSKNAMGAFGNDFVLDGTSYKLFVDDEGKATPEEQSIELQYKTSGQYYKKYGGNIVNDWLAVINYAAKATNQGGIDYGIDYVSVSDKLSGINEWNSGSFWYSENIHPFLRGRDAALFYAAKAGVTLNNFVHYQSNGKTLTNTHKGSPLIVKPSLIDEIARYEHEDSSKLKEWLDQKLISDVNQIKKTDFLLTGAAANFVTKNYPTEALRFKRPGFSDFYVANNTGTITSVDEINPAYRKFFYDWNFLSDNLLNFALGNIHAHKGMNPNAAWTAMTKRNVMAGASIIPFGLGLEQGVEEHTRTAYIDDIVTPITTIHGDTEPIVDLDGGAYVTMTQRIKSWNSLNQKYQGNGGLEQKPFISNIDLIGGQNGMTKFADFALDAETIRNSIGSDIDFMKLHKEQLYNYPIGHLDVTKSWKEGINLGHLDMYVYRRDFNHETGKVGKIEYLDRIEQLNGNRYRLHMGNPEVLNSSYSREIVLNTWFDLWQALGDIDSVAPSKKQTGIYHVAPNGTKVYYEPSHSSWEKLLDYESYIGEPNHLSINPKYIVQTGDREIDSVYDLYKTLTGERDIVIPKLELLAEAGLNGDISLNDFQALGLHNTITAREFIDVAEANADDISDFFNHVHEQIKNPEIRSQAKTWQPIKGKLIDRIATAGAQKFGQFNMNRSATFSQSAKEKFIAEASNDINNSLPAEQIDLAYIDQLLTNGEIVEDCQE
jgi:hypothetical protein